MGSRNKRQKAEKGSCSTSDSLAPNTHDAGPSFFTWNQFNAQMSSINDSIRPEPYPSPLQPSPTLPWLAAAVAAPPAEPPSARRPPAFTALEHGAQGFFADPFHSDWPHW